MTLLNPPTDARALSQSLERAYMAIKKGDFAACDADLEDARSKVASHDDARQRIERWKCFAKYAKAYPQLRDDALKAACQGRDFGLDEEDDKFTVSGGIPEGAPTRIVYKYRGTQKTVAIEDLDPRFEWAIVKKWLYADGQATNHIYLGVRALCLDPANLTQCQVQWQLAQQKGFSTEQLQALMPLLQDPVFRGSGK